MFWIGSSEKHTHSHLSGQHSSRIDGFSSARSSVQNQTRASAQVYVLPGQSQQVFGVADGSGDGVGLSLTMGVLVGSSARAGVWAESAAIGSNTARVSVIAAAARDRMLFIRPCAAFTEKGKNAS